MGFSSGGYAALLAAAKVRAVGYLGFSVSTDFGLDAASPADSLAAARNSVPDDLFADLRTMLGASASPERGILYYGEESIGDAAQARRMADLPNFVVEEVPGARHNTVMALLAEGRFQQVVSRFLR
jgi:predicted dienelactone hydrolase